MHTYKLAINGKPKCGKLKALVVAFLNIIMKEVKFSLFFPDSIPIPRVPLTEHDSIG